MPGDGPGPGRGMGRRGRGGGAANGLGLRGPLTSGPSRGEQNDYCQHFVDTGARPQNFLRDVHLVRLGSPLLPHFWSAGIGTLD